MIPVALQEDQKSKPYYGKKKPAKNQAQSSKPIDIPTLQEESMPEAKGTGSQLEKTEESTSDKSEEVHYFSCVKMLLSIL